MLAPFAAIAALLLFMPPAHAISPEEELLLTTRTVEPTVSPQLATALDLDMPFWHKPGAAKLDVKIGPETRQASKQAALDALQALPASAAQNDFDRAWIALQKGAALQDLDRNPEASAAFATVLDIPGRTMMQDRTARAALHDLGEPGLPGWCGRDAGLPRSALPDYPQLANRATIGGWTYVVADVAADGHVEYVFVVGSSMRVFEKPTVEWMKSMRAVNEKGGAPGRPCSMRFTVRFDMQAKRVLFDGNDVFAKNEGVWSYPSIGASRRVREDAVRALQRGEPEPATLAPR